MRAGALRAAGRSSTAEGRSRGGSCHPPLHTRWFLPGGAYQWVQTEILSFWTVIQFSNFLATFVSKLNGFSQNPVEYFDLNNHILKHSGFLHRFSAPETPLAVRRTARVRAARRHAVLSPPHVWLDYCVLRIFGRMFSFSATPRTHRCAQAALRISFCHAAVRLLGSTSYCFCVFEYF